MSVRPLFGTLLLLLLAACSTIPPPDVRRQSALALVQARHWQSVTIDTRSFRLQAFTPAVYSIDRQLTLYLEGDGFAWVSSSQPSADPTPIDPLGLRLALAQPIGNAAYLARPCQYIGAGQSNCARRYWTDARFAEEVVDSLDQAVGELKARAGAEKLVLVGYSGGAALALLLAERRTDVSAVVSVAGNLDHRAWTELHHVSPLNASLNPADNRQALAGIKQLHLTGENDTVVPHELAERFVAGHSNQVWLLPGYDHHCCWVQDWPELWRKIEQRLGAP
ncbi:alpha/beta hydrolase family protein [Pseudomonas sp. NPDC089569]|uniref:alpha/beta hydrolase family protein n=1 Tax=Pseudomonas sp. NPDC089569 TaxID=3390722 RepID=UPI003D059F75